VVGATNVPGIAEMANITEYITSMSLFAATETNADGKEVPVLADNGGTFKTLALAANGVATGQGIATLDGFEIPTTDQRGYTRLTPPSIGAFEYNGVGTGIDVEKLIQTGITNIGKQVFFSSSLSGSAMIFNMSGACVYQANINGGGLSTELQQGVYIVKLVQPAGENIVQKVILN
jgi:hypothetical protein